MVTSQMAKKKMPTTPKRRVSDLLAVNIPEDEAKLLSNGRLACMVCHHNPVFDTIDMLTIHRSGKKHVQNAAYHEEQKRELKELIQKRRQDEFAKTGSTHIKVASQHLKSLSSTVAYDSRVKKLKPYDRKLKVNLSTPTETTASSSSKTSEIIKMQSEGPIKHSSQLKNIFTHAPKPELQIRPYERKFGKIGKSISKQKSDSAVGVVTSVTGEMVGLAEDVGVNEPHESRTVSGGSDVSCESQMVSGSGTAAPSTSTQDSNPDEGTSSVKKSQELATKYWQMAGSGWKKDWDGKWIRDEDCEYDSDEETPDLP